MLFRCRCTQAGRFFARLSSGPGGGLLRCTTWPASLPFSLSGECPGRYLDRGSLAVFDRRYGDYRLYLVKWVRWSFMQALMWVVSHELAHLVDTTDTEREDSFEDGYRQNNTPVGPYPRIQTYFQSLRGRWQYPLPLIQIVSVSWKSRSIEIEINKQTFELSISRIHLYINHLPVCLG